MTEPAGFKRFTLLKEYCNVSEEIKFLDFGSIDFINLEFL
jgi:hypothetical protein